MDTPREALTDWPGGEVDVLRGWLTSPELPDFLVWNLKWEKVVASEAVATEIVAIALRIFETDQDRITPSPRLRPDEPTHWPYQRLVDALKIVTEDPTVPLEEAMLCSEFLR